MKNLAPVLLRQLVCLGLAACVAVELRAQTPTSLSELKSLSLEQLLDVEVTSVSRRNEKLVNAAAAVEVLTADRITRAGAFTLPDALRLATGVQVTQITGHEWAVSARGFASLASEKMEVTLDGRSLYSPLFTGVTWDVPSVVMEDLDRIEIIRGPGAALWGSNSVNGVVSIVTKSASETQGAYVSATVGTHENHAAVRYGGEVGSGFFRVYAQGWSGNGLDLPSGAEAIDSREMAKVGARADLPVGRLGSLTLQGEFYDGWFRQIGISQGELRGGHVLARYETPWGGDAKFRWQGLYDRSLRDIPGSLMEKRATLDSFAEVELPGERYTATVGARVRVSRDEFDARATLRFAPNERTLAYYTLYAQGRLTLPDERWAVTAGAAIEDNTYTGIEVQPTLRLSFAPQPSWMVWVGASHAVRTPSRIDAELIQAGPGGLTLLEGSRDFQSETLDSLEAGWRWQHGDVFSAEVSAFANRYGQLRTFEPATPPVLFRMGNLAEGETHGAEVTLTLRPRPTVRLIMSGRWLDKELNLLPESRNPGPPATHGNDARRVASAQLSWDVTPRLQADVVLRHVSALPRPSVPDYTESDVRVAWRVNDNWEIAATGRNLLHARHQETRDSTQLEFVPRSLYFTLTWRN